MSADVCVRFEHTSKRYRRRGNGRLSGLFRGNSSRASRASDSFWALDDVSFALERGETLGIIGPNGAGKSTVLKLLAGIARPSTGLVEVRGRVASLIEVGAGFHPDLTGRQNVYLNGAIMGMSRAEIKRKFDQIVEFAELADFIDVPVKRYSSGMYMRLGFSVAAQLEPDVLLVDEVLAVGDRSFQAKSVQRMHEVANSGATVIFISHDLNAVQGLCGRGIYLRHGRIVVDGSVQEAIHRYLDDVDAAQSRVEWPQGSPTPRDVDITRVVCRDEYGDETGKFTTGKPLIIDLEYVAHKPIERPSFVIGIGDGRGGYIALASMLVDGCAPERIEGQGVMRCRFDTLALLPKTYHVWCEVRSAQHGWGLLVPWHVRGRFRVVDVDSAYMPVADNAGIAHMRVDATVYLPYHWEHIDAVQAGQCRSCLR